MGGSVYPVRKNGPAVGAAAFTLSGKTGQRWAAAFILSGRTGRRWGRQHLSYHLIPHPLTHPRVSQLHQNGSACLPPPPPPPPLLRSVSPRSRQAAAPVNLGVACPAALQPREGRKGQVQQVVVDKVAGSDAACHARHASRARRGAAQNRPIVPSPPNPGEHSRFPPAACNHAAPCRHVAQPLRGPIPRRTTPNQTILTATPPNHRPSDPPHQRQTRRRPARSALPPCWP